MNQLDPVRSGNAGVIQFRADLQRAADSVEVKLALFLKKLTLDLFNLIVGDTPVDTGRARASWNIALNEPNLAIPPDIPAEDRKARDAARARGESLGPHPLFSDFAGEKPPLPHILEQIDGTQRIFITSNLVYIGALESGHSGQAPQGMVALNVAALEASVQAALNESSDSGSRPTL